MPALLPEEETMTKTVADFMLECLAADPAAPHHQEPGEELCQGAPEGRSGSARHRLAYPRASPGLKSQSEAPVARIPRSRETAMNETLHPPQEQKRQPGRERQMDPPPADMTRFPGSGRLNGTVALITGGDSGIGRAAAVAMARESAPIALPLAARLGGVPAAWSPPPYPTPRSGKRRVGTEGCMTGRPG